jgi:lysozyme family protein
VNHPADRGGPTRFGITEAVARAHGYAGPMALLPREEAAAIYRRLYWLRPRFDQVARALRGSPPSCSTPASTWGRASPPPSSSAR